MGLVIDYPTAVVQLTTFTIFRMVRLAIDRTKRKSKAKLFGAMKDL
jgi:hypothetical protein